MAFTSPMSVSVPGHAIVVDGWCGRVVMSVELTPLRHMDSAAQPRVRFPPVSVGGHP
jgi:hypothetical protein